MVILILPLKNFLRSDCRTRLIFVIESVTASRKKEKSGLQCLINLSRPPTGHFVFGKEACSRKPSKISSEKVDAFPKRNELLPRSGRVCPAERLALAALLDCDGGG